MKRVPCLIKKRCPLFAFASCVPTIIRNTWQTIASVLEVNALNAFWSCRFVCRLTLEFSSVFFGLNAPCSCLLFVLVHVLVWCCLVFLSWSKREYREVFLKDICHLVRFFFLCLILSWDTRLLTRLLPQNAFGYSLLKENMWGRGSSAFFESSIGLTGDMVNCDIFFVGFRFTLRFFFFSPWEPELPSFRFSEMLSMVFSLS